jgi:hypothetical protein
MTRKLLIYGELRRMVEDVAVAYFNHLEGFQKLWEASVRISQASVEIGTGFSGIQGRLIST